MAHVFPDSGLSALLGVWPRSAYNDAVTYVGLFASQTSGTVPSRTAYGGATPSGWTESPGVARQAISAGQWGAGSAAGNGWKITGAQVTFPTASAIYTACGFFLSNKVSSQSGDVVYFFANFDDLTALAVASGDVVRVTPSLQWNISALA